MGYEIQFEGYLKLSKPLTVERQRWFNDWSEIRKQHYGSEMLNNHYKGVGSLDGDYGENGEFFGYVPSELIESYDETYNWEEYEQWINGENPLMFPIEGKQNNPPSNQPSLWCNWKIEGDTLFCGLEDGYGKFYGYLEWLEYIRLNILSKWGIHFKEGNSIRWRGEDFDDIGMVEYDESGNQIIKCWEQI